MQLSCLLVMLSLNLFDSCIKPTWYNVSQDVLFERFTLVFPRVYNDIHDPIDQKELIRLILLVFISRPTQCTASGWYELLPSKNFTLF